MAIEVWTIQDLININNNLSEDYIQMADIDISDYEDWQAIALDFYNPFTGKYNGNGFKFIGKPSLTGRWGHGIFCFTESAVFENVFVEGLSLIIYDRGGSLFINCHTKNVLFNGSENPDIEGEFLSGFICFIEATAENKTTIENCSAENITIKNNTRGVGGFLGYGQHVECYNCIVKNFSTINVSDAGGFGLTLRDSSILKNCSASVNIKSNEIIGGFAKLIFSSTVEECFASGTLESSENIAGFSGTIPNSIVKNCYFKGDIICTSSGKQIGGFSYMAPSSLYDCYAVANISALDANIYGFAYPPVDIVNCYYNSDLTGITAGAGEPRTTEQMTYPYDENTYEGWDFDNIWGADITYKNEGYPFLRAFDVVIETPTEFREPTIETYRVNCANPDIILKAYPPEQGEGTAHFKIDMYDEGKVLIDSVNTLSSPERFKYSKDKINWSDFPKEGLMIQDDIYIKATIYIGPRRGIWLKAGIGEGE